MPCRRYDAERILRNDIPSTYSVVIEGVADDGKIIYKREKVKVGVTH